MTNTMFPRQFQVGSSVVRGEGTAVMLRNFELAKTGICHEIELVAPAAELIDFAEAVCDAVDALTVQVVEAQPGTPDVDYSDVEIQMIADLNEVYAVAEDESNHPLLAQRDDEESRLHQIYDELNALGIVALRKQASRAGLKGAYTGYSKTELVAFLFNKAKSA